MILGTLTGSIGVIISSPFLKEALNHYGVNVELLKRGENADLLSPFTQITSEQEELIEKLMDEVYEEFKRAVHLERGLPPEHVHSKAQGRIWLGKDASDSDLIDELGGLTTAIQVAKRGAALPPDANVVDFPSPHRIADMISGVLHQLTTGGPSQLARLRSSVEMYSFEADIIFGSIS